MLYESLAESVRAMPRLEHQLRQQTDMRDAGVKGEVREELVTVRPNVESWEDVGKVVHQRRVDGLLAR